MQVSVLQNLGLINDLKSMVFNLEQASDGVTDTVKYSGSKFISRNYGDEEGEEDERP